MEPRFQGKGVVLGEYFLVSTKPDTFCYLTVQTAPCYGAVVLTHYWHVRDGQTDGQTDGNAIASTALAMLGAHCKKINILFWNKWQRKSIPYSNPLT